MTSNKKWGCINNTSSDKVKVILFVSRRKDNKELENFEERRTSFISDREPDSKYIQEKFDDFVNNGQPGEMCRMYASVNARHLPTVRKQLIHFLIDDEEFNLCSIQSKIAGIAAQKECAAEKKWLIDYDGPDSKLEECMDDIFKMDETIEIFQWKTPNGYALILNHGFDSREFTEKWKDLATIKKDDMLCITWKEKKYES